MSRGPDPNLPAHRRYQRYGECDDCGQQRSLRKRKAGWLCGMCQEIRGSVGPRLTFRDRPDLMQERRTAAAYLRP